MGETIGWLVLAAALEIGGDAAIRNGLTQSRWISGLGGCALLAGYGFFVNSNRVLDFGRIMGLYIAVFFVVSQAISFVLLGERPAAGLVAGGALIVTGGLVILLWK